MLQKGNYALNNPTAPGAPFFCVSGFELYGTLSDDEGLVIGTDFKDTVAACREKIVRRFIDEE